MLSITENSSSAKSSDSSGRPLRLVVFSSMGPVAINHLLWRLAIDLSECNVGGVLYEWPRPALSPGKRLYRFVKLLREPALIRYVVHRAWPVVAAAGVRSVDAALRFVHAAPPDPNGPSPSLDAVIAEWTAKGIAFHETRDIHDEDSLAFVRRVNADIGLIYGTRI